MSSSEPVETPLPEKPPLPEFTLKNVLNDLVSGVNELLFNPYYNIIVIPVLVAFELFAVKFIKHTVPYTEIDYTAYMEQIAIIKGGELDYANIYGGTGPLVYPAGHVWIYKVLYWITQGTEDVGSGQFVFGIIYVFTQSLVFLIYYNLELPPWVLGLLVLSKRLHSIYVLRLFNDCFATLFSVLTVLSLQRAATLKNKEKHVSKIITNFTAPLFYGFAISVKMNALLYLPGFLVVTYFLNDEILLLTFVPISVIITLQVLLGYDFLFNGQYIRDSYIANAFDFGRKFLYKWTVNWRFLPEDIFNSDTFHQALLAVQITLLLTFVFTKWASKRETSKSITSLIIDGLKIYKPTLSPSHIINDPKLGARYVVGVLASSNLIGVLTARSLHYQFLSWYAWTLPYFLYHSPFYFFVNGLVYLAHEWCWNVYPSTIESSGLLLFINASVLLGYWLNTSIYTKNLIEQGKKDK